jgi:malonyl-CoA O-methyltransferase
MHPSAPWPATETTPADPPTADRYTRAIDPAALAHISRRMATASSPPWLHGEVARRMAERLPIIKMQPTHVVDASGYLGASQVALTQTYPSAQLTVVEPHPVRRGALAQALAVPWWSPKRLMGPARAAVAPAEVPPASAQLLWANMALHAAANPPALLAQWHRALQVDGFLMFSTLGPGTLQSLQQLYRHHGWPTPFAPLVDMHDIGDMLVAAGFADPVMDQELITLTWPSPQALLLELRQLGGNAAWARFAGLRTPRWHHALCDALATLAGPDGRPALVFEVVYGHAFKPLPRVPVAAQTTLAAADLQQMARAAAKAGRPHR